MSLFGLDDATLIERDALWTAREIHQQPVAWGHVRELLEARLDSSEKALAPLLSRKDLRVILTGAGTSAFVGDILTPVLSRCLSLRVESIATTDLVSGPDRFLQRDVPTLLVSFARSGDSPESVAALELAEREIASCHHLIVTCNRAGALCARGQALPNAYVVVLPEQTHDRAFAMTSSFTSMLLCAAGLFGVIPASSVAWSRMSRAAEAMMSWLMDHGRALLGADLGRVVFLGSNELKGLARESALKVLELTDGKVAAIHESSLGIRHGPKSIIDPRTLVVLLMSNEAYARRYDLDLLAELRGDGRAANVIALSATTEGLSSTDGVIPIEGMTACADIELAPVLVIFSQLLALFQSLRLNNRPDHPSATGTVNRVVRGVTIHPWKPEVCDVHRH